jgi:hypothetical protein
MHLLRFLAMVAVLAAAAGSAAAQDSTTAPPRPARRLANEISAEQLRGSDAPSAYELVRSLHPNWLRPRARVEVMDGNVEALIPVYVDGTRLGGVDVLRGLMPGGLASIRFLDPSSAQLRYGSGHLNGAIVVTTRGREG